ncbi:MAG: hypothetical protein V4844_09625 [Pseudomonadota bacterium]|jgi:hypothetical protein
MGTAGSRDEWIAEFALLISQDAGISLRDASGMAPRFYAELQNFEPSEAAAIVATTGLIRREDRGLRGAPPSAARTERRGQPQAVP